MVRLESTEAVVSWREVVVRLRQKAGTGRKRKRIGLPLKTTIAEGRCYL